ncbi:MAG: sensor histidine kinase [Gemmatimonadaceae bacterium]
MKIAPPTPTPSNEEGLLERDSRPSELAPYSARTSPALRDHDARMTEFLANISHDLRTPLTAIITHAEILRDGILGDLSPRQEDSVRGIISGGRQLLDMVGEILTYARGAANQLTLDASSFAIGDIVERASTLSEPLIAAKGLAFSISSEPALPQLFADRQKIVHVINNLLSNAIDFTPPGGSVWITVRDMPATSDRERQIAVEVGDTGIGIAPENHELVFREFAQVDTTASRRHHGTGLGLAIARKFVELHGGRIWVESALGQGARFIFTIPVRDWATGCQPTS